MNLFFSTRFSKTNINTLSMLTEKIIEHILNLLVLATMARVLGPSVFGVFGLVQAAYAMGRPAAAAVNEQLLVQYQIKKNRHPIALQNIALKIKLCTSVIVYTITITLSYVYLEQQTLYLVAIFCLMHFLNIQQINFSYYRAKELSHLVLTTKILLTIPFGLAKIFAIIYFKTLLPIVILYVIEVSFISAISLIVTRRSIANDNALSVKSTHLKELFVSSWPLLASATVIAAYTRVDQFMINHYLPSDQLGYYTAALKITIIIQYLLATFLSSRFPRLLKIRNKSKESYDRQLIKLMRLCLIIGVSFTLFLAFFGDKVVTLLYGDRFLEATSILVISSISTTFVLYGLLCTQWLIAEDLQIYRLRRVIIGLVINIVLNLWMIPKFGIQGAAISTVISQAASSIFLNALNKQTRPIFSLQLKSIIPNIKV